jgi:hypothetical protein
VTNTQFAEMMRELRAIRASVERSEELALNIANGAPSDTATVLGVTRGGGAVIDDRRASTEPDFVAEAREARAVRTNITPPGTRGQGKRGRR